MRWLFVFALAACQSQLPPPRSEGERLYRARCTGCHRAYDPSERSDWTAMVAKMEGEKKVLLAPEERAQIAGFLNSGKPLR